MSGYEKRIALAAQIDDHSAFVRNFIGIAQFIQHGADQFLDLLILPGRTVRFQKFFQGLQTIFFVKSLHTAPSNCFSCFLS